MGKLLKIEKYRCRDCGEEFTEFKFAQTHCMVNNHWCDAIPKLPLEYEEEVMDEEKCIFWETCAVATETKMMCIDKNRSKSCSLWKHKTMKEQK